MPPSRMSVCGKLPAQTVEPREAFCLPLGAFRRWGKWQGHRGPLAYIVNALFYIWCRMHSTAACPPVTWGATSNNAEHAACWRRQTGGGSTLPQPSLLTMACHGGPFHSDTPPQVADHLQHGIYSTRCNACLARRVRVTACHVSMPHKGREQAPSVPLEAEATASHSIH